MLREVSHVNVMFGFDPLEGRNSQVVLGTYRLRADLKNIIARRNEWR